MRDSNSHLIGSKFRIGAEPPTNHADRHQGDAVVSDGADHGLGVVAA